MIGIVLLGIPHGAADLLIANKTAIYKKAIFSKITFLIKYVSRLFAFAAILYFFPLIGNLLFIVFAAYHFGETDLSNFKTNTFTGKLFVISYGLLILGVILLPHFQEIKPMFALFESGKKYDYFINFIDEYRIIILSIIAALFFISTFIYFSINEKPAIDTDKFIVQLALLVLILFNLPMIIGFTLYFVVWHSVLSIKNIVTYLKVDEKLKDSTIVKQILLYSLLAILGLGMFGVTGFMFTSANAMMVYIFLGLAVLTAPHMQIMHNMYNEIRNFKKTN
jgi:Brp/Blh family beta-carotene 15,15'-monooxygenase